MATYDVPPPLAELVESQAGVVSRTQVLKAGFSPQLARRRVEQGRWQHPHRGVYAAFSGPLSREAQVWAALLRCGEGSVASHQTAAELEGVCELVDDRVHVTVPAWRNVRGRLDGIVLHRAHRLPESRHPARTPPRTRVEDTVLDLVDVAASAREVAGWVTAAVQRRRTTPVRLAHTLAGRKKIRWRPQAEAMLLDVAEGANSPLELEHLRAVERAHGLPGGGRQRRRWGGRVIWVDVDYEKYRTRVELDGRLGHVAEGQFRDRRRDNRATVGGRWSLRYGYAEVFGTPCDVAAEQALVLSERGWTGSPRECGPECRLRTAAARLLADRAA